MASEQLPLAGPKSNALIIGASSFKPDSGLVGYWSINESAQCVAKVLKERCGMADDRVRVLIDQDANTVLRVLTEKAEAAHGGVFLLYYIGHGLLQTTTAETSLMLAAADTVETGPDRYAPDSVIPFGEVQDALSATGRPAVIILDCCFSANAAKRFATIVDSRFVSSTPFGTYLLTATGLNERAFGPDPADPHAPARPTLFTGALVELLTQGDPQLPALIRLEDCYVHLKRRADDPPAATRFPQPWAYRSGDIGSLVLAPNGAISQPVIPAAEAPADDVGRPYMGLHPYSPRDTHLFAGRTHALSTLSSALIKSADAGLPLVVTGASGVGKSSLIQAGLVPALERNALPGWSTTDSWPILGMTPEDQPLVSLAAVLADSSGGAPDAILRALRSDPDSVVGQLDRIRLTEGRRRTAERVVLIIDQFEELFTRAGGARKDKADREQFVQTLSAAARKRRDGTGPSAVVVVVVRGDHFIACANYPGLLNTVVRNDAVVAPMNDRELRQVVVEPAETCGLTVSPELVERLVADLRGGAAVGANDDYELSWSQGYDASGALPLLSHALEQTFNRRTGRILTLDGYQSSGGIWGSVAHAADTVYQALADFPRGQDTARLLLLSMVQLGHNADDSRRRIELEPASLGDVTPDLVNEVARRFAQARLITLDQTGKGQATATLTHEAILRSWPALREWIERDRGALFTRQQLLEASETWQSNDRDLWIGLTEGRTFPMDRWSRAWPALARRSGRYARADGSG
jgi:hypothetical protein